MARRPRGTQDRGLPESPGSGSRKRPKGIKPAASDPEDVKRPMPPIGPAWLEERNRQRVTELNTGLIRAMLARAEQARARRETGSHPQVLEQLAALDAAARERLARVPFVLLDAGFAVRGVWATEHLNQASTHMEDSRFVDGYDLHVLARAFFTFAWRFTYTYPEGAGIVLGMPSHTVPVFANLSLRDLERIIMQRGHWVRPRWEEKPERWHRLLLRAQTASDPAQVDQRALQLLYGDLFQDLK